MLLGQRQCQLAQLGGELRRVELFARQRPGAGVVEEGGHQAGEAAELVLDPRHVRRLGPAAKVGGERAGEELHGAEGVAHLMSDAGQHRLPLAVAGVQRLAHLLQGAAQRLHLAGRGGRRERRREVALAHAARRLRQRAEWPGDGQRRRRRGGRTQHRAGERQRHEQAPEAAQGGERGRGAVGGDDRHHLPAGVEERGVAGLVELAVRAAKEHLARHGLPGADLPELEAIALERRERLADAAGPVGVGERRPVEPRHQQAGAGGARQRGEARLHVTVGARPLVARPERGDPLGGQAGRRRLRHRHEPRPELVLQRAARQPIAEERHHRQRDQGRQGGGEGEAQAHLVMLPRPAARAVALEIG